MSSEAKPASPRIGVQLWSVEASLADDFEPTLRAIANMGYAGVEFAGEFGPYQDDAEGLRQLLDELSIQATSAHVSFEQLQPATINKTVDFYQRLGVTTLIIGWDPRGWSEAGIDALINDLNAADSALESHSMRIGYHNHNREFDPFADRTYWDYLARRTRPSVLLQLDIGWVVFAGKDPQAYLQRHSARIVSTHYKVVPLENSKASPIIGDDSLDWAALTTTVARGGTVEWLIVEQETYPAGLTPLQSIAASKRGLDRLLNTTE